MPTRDTFRYREAFEGARGTLPGEIAPRLLLIHDFPAGPDGLTSPRAGAGMNFTDLQRFFSDGEFDYGLDFAEVFSRQVDGAARPGAIDVYRVVGEGAVRASGIMQDNFDTGVDPDNPTYTTLGLFEAVGAGPAYNKTIRLEVTRIESSASNPHPAGAVVPVFTVTIPSPNPDALPEVIRNVVFTFEGGKGTSAYHRTIDAASITDRSMIVNFSYDPSAEDANLSNMAVGDVIDIPMTGGVDGGALSDDDWQAAFDAVVGLPFRWRVVPNPANETVRANLHISNKSSPFGHAFAPNLYGETVEDFITARETMGSEADDGKTSLVWGWGAHPVVGGRETPYLAAYLGRYSAKINSAGMGGEYPVGGLNLGFTSIAEAHVLTAAEEEALSQRSIMFAKQLTSGSYGVHGSWTIDSQFDRMGDLATRIIWNDVIRRIALVAEPLAHNRAAHLLTQRRIKISCDQAIQPYIQRGYLRVANTGVSSLEEANRRYPGLTFPQELLGWVVYLAQLVFYPTLQGIFAHFTDADVAGLTSLLSGSGEGGNAAPAE